MPTKLATTGDLLLGRHVEAAGREVRLPGPARKLPPTNPHHLKRSSIITSIHPIEEERNTCENKKMYIWTVVLAEKKLTCF